VIDHVELDLTVDFQQRIVHGHAVHHVREAEQIDAPVLLHTNGLVLHAVWVDPGDTWVEAEWELRDAVPGKGRDLLVTLPDGADRIKVDYASRPEAAGLQWLEPGQTAGGDHPFVYSQGQSIYNRSWIPLFDDPSVRITYDAVLRVDNGLRALMAAEDRSDPSEEGVFRFHMPQPIPSYLIAMAVGDLAFREIGPRSGVWAEPEIVDDAHAEFVDTEDMIVAVEELYGPYRWGRFDVLVLPPAFPYGGMENPRLTFATPTIIAGDRSLVALIAHELAHSWSGNLVTNATWDDFWLNEGFTVYLERRIIEKLFGRERSEMEAMIGRDDLIEDLDDMGHEHPDTRLVVDLAGRHPDDAFSNVPYEKGYLLLRRFEETFGRTTFDRFLREYFDTHAFETMTTGRFVEILHDELFTKDPEAAARIDLDVWLHQPGVPDTAPVAQSDAFGRVDAAAARFVGNGTLPGTEAWTAFEWIHFLDVLPDDLEPARMATLDGAFDLTHSRNYEILCEWLILSLETGYRAADPQVEQFLLEVGRRKFVQPLFEALLGAENGLDRAQEIYERARPGYHSVTYNTVDRILAEESAEQGE